MKESITDGLNPKPERKTNRILRGCVDRKVLLSAYNISNDTFNGLLRDREKELGFTLKSKKKFTPLECQKIYSILGHPNHDENR